MNQFGWKLLLVAVSLATLVIAPACSDTEGDGAEETEEGDNNGGGRPGGGGNEEEEEEQDGESGGGLDASITPDTGGGGGSDAGGGGGGGELDPEEYCPLLGDSPQAGQACTGNTPNECGTTGQCLQLQTDASPKCYTVCLPELCGNTCGGSEDCLSLVAVDPDTDEQTPALVDLDQDGTDDTQLGACSEPPVGDVTTYGTCSGAEACVADNRCVALNATLGVCATECSAPTDCSSIGGVAGSCVEVQFSTPDGEVTETTNLCLLPCTVGGDAGECPADFTCTSSPGGALCIAN